MNRRRRWKAKARRAERKRWEHRRQLRPGFLFVKPEGTYGQTVGAIQGGLSGRLEVGRAQRRMEHVMPDWGQW
jgi:hypothetical protein